MTAILFFAVSFASPSITVILFFFIRNLTPFDSWPATLRLRSTILRDIEFDVVGAEPEFVQPMQQVKDLRRAQQRLRRDAAPIETDAAQMLALDDRGLEAELARADRGDIAAGPLPMTIKSNCVSAIWTAPRAAVGTGSPMLRAVSTKRRPHHSGRRRNLVLALFRTMCKPRPDRKRESESMMIGYVTIGALDERKVRQILRCRLRRDGLRPQVQGRRLDRLRREGPRQPRRLRRLEDRQRRTRARRQRDHDLVQGEDEERKSRPPTKRA